MYSEAVQTLGRRRRSNEEDKKEGTRERRRKADRGGGRRDRRDGGGKDGRRKLCIRYAHDSFFYFMYWEMVDCVMACGLCGGLCLPCTSGCARVVRTIPGLLLLVVKVRHSIEEL